MTAQVLSFFQRSPRLAPRPADWTQQELAEFYRVESALIRAGIRVGTDRGLSDENEPWFVFYRVDDGDVVIHFARIDGEYVIAGPAYEEIARGFDFTALVRNMVARHPLIRRSDKSSNLSIHPAALLVAVVGTAFFKSGEARADTNGTTGSGASRPALLSSSKPAPAARAFSASSTEASYDTAQLPANQAVLILAAALLASDYQVETETMSPGVRTAIASAAAALDFSGAPALSSHVGDVALDRAPTAEIIASPTHMISSVLSLVSLLSTLPPSQEGVSVGDSTLHGEMLRDDPPLKFQVLQNADTSAWAIDVRLSHSDVFAIDAIQLVRGALSDTAPQKITVIEVDKLPNVLASIIARGTHFEVSEPSKPQEPETTSPPAAGNVGGADSSATPPHTDSQPHPPEPPPPAQQTQSPTTNGNSPFSGIASMELVRQFIDYFISHTSSVQIVTQGREVTLFDTRVMSHPGEIHELTSMTFHFFDGSTINLVGDHSSFLHDNVSV